MRQLVNPEKRLTNRQVDISSGCRRRASRRDPSIAATLRDRREPRELFSRTKICHNERSQARTSLSSNLTLTIMYHYITVRFPIVHIPRSSRRPFVQSTSCCLRIPMRFRILAPSFIAARTSLNRDTESVSEEGRGLPILASRVSFCDSSHFTISEASFRSSSVSRSPYPIPDSSITFLASHGCVSCVGLRVMNRLIGSNVTILNVEICVLEVVNLSEDSAICLLLVCSGPFFQDQIDLEVPIALYQVLAMKYLHRSWLLTLGYAALCIRMFSSDNRPEGVERRCSAISTSKYCLSFLPFWIFSPGTRLREHTCQPLSIHLPIYEFDTYLRLSYPRKRLRHELLHLWFGVGRLMVWDAHSRSDVLITVDYEDLTIEIRAVGDICPTLGYCTSLSAPHGCVYSPKPLREVARYESLHGTAHAGFLPHYHGQTCAYCLLALRQHAVAADPWARVGMSKLARFPNDISTSTIAASPPLETCGLWDFHLNALQPASHGILVRFSYSIIVTSGHFAGSGHCAIGSMLQTRLLKQRPLSLSCAEFDKLGIFFLPHYNHVHVKRGQNRSASNQNLSSVDSRTADRRTSGTSIFVVGDTVKWGWANSIVFFLWTLEQQERFIRAAWKEWLQPSYRHHPVRMVYDLNLHSITLPSHHLDTHLDTHQCFVQELSAVPLLWVAFRPDALVTGSNKVQLARLLNEMWSKTDARRSDVSWRLLKAPLPLIPRGFIGTTAERPTRRQLNFNNPTFQSPSAQHEAPSCTSRLPLSNCHAESTGTLPRALSVRGRLPLEIAVPTTVTHHASQVLSACIQSIPDKCSLRIPFSTARLNQDEDYHNHFTFPFLQSGIFPMCFDVSKCSVILKHPCQSCQPDFTRRPGNGTLSHACASLTNILLSSCRRRKSQQNPSFGTVTSFANHEVETTSWEGASSVSLLGCLTFSLRDCEPPAWMTPKILLSFRSYLFPLLDTFTIVNHYIHMFAVWILDAISHHYPYSVPLAQTSQNRCPIASLGVVSFMLLRQPEYSVIIFKFQAENVSLVMMLTENATGLVVSFGYKHPTWVDVKPEQKVNLLLDCHDKFHDNECACLIFQSIHFHTIELLFTFPLAQPMHNLICFPHCVQLRVKGIGLPFTFLFGSSFHPTYTLPSSCGSNNKAPKENIINQNLSFPPRSSTLHQISHRSEYKKDASITASIESAPKLPLDNILLPLSCWIIGRFGKCFENTCSLKLRAIFPQGCRVPNKLTNNPLKKIASLSFRVNTFLGNSRRQVDYQIEFMASQNSYCAVSANVFHQSPGQTTHQATSKPTKNRNPAP
ncbi:uncharacterized protein BDR25DRAFT_350711 [Lindgomyces ingoldianus]|uniref:Uncharacterized protein n=1 Tax=Lindgomyces ingoldianus TaxID=673940 RepID=A0ACB6R8A2_9PLEO|nr:uncharacterized protein BDR25DRAFT_350711 [Lindgomyces ingoldianus]KAF2475322.1 hypothetical protein BDR25DRAFT_350711 [Lindgomyces ingoldianus]